MSEPSAAAKGEEVDPGGDLAGRRVDGYEVEELLGQGGIGEVYRAHDVALDRTVALKALLPRLAGDPVVQSRFEREARAASAIDHPHVVRILAFGRCEGRPYYVMEHLGGGSLAARVAAGRIPGPQCLQWLREAAEGLRAAWAQGIVHRDVKPHNLMLADDGHLEVVDFGLARRVEGDVSLTRSDAVLGTPTYMAPEQALGAPADFRSDLYSLGATFYHLLAGEPPYQADTPIAMLLQHVQDTPPPLRHVEPRVPPAVARIVDRLLAKLPGDRYPSYDDLLADIARAQSRPGAGGVEGQRTGGALASTWASPRGVGRLYTPPPAAAPAPPPPAAAPRHPLRTLGLAVLVALAAFGLWSLGRRSAPPATPAVSPDAGDPGRTMPSDTPRSEAPRNDTPESSAPPGFLDAPQRAQAVGMALAAGSAATLRRVSLSVETFRAERGVLPTALDELVAAYDVPGRDLLDGWRREVRYEALGRDEYRLRSAGADGAFDTADDVVLEDGAIRGPGLPTAEDLQRFSGAS